MIEDSGFNKKQKKEEDNGIAPDFCGSLGKGMFAKENIETLGNSSGLTPLGFDVDVSNRIMNRGPVNDGFSIPECKEIHNSQGLSPLRPSGEIYCINNKSLSPAEDFSSTEDLETLKCSSGLTPLYFDIDERRDLQLRTKSPVITNLHAKESEFDDR